MRGNSHSAAPIVKGGYIGVAIVLILLGGCESPTYVRFEGGGPHVDSGSGGRQVPSVINIGSAGGSDGQGGLDTGGTGVGVGGMNGNAGTGGVTCAAGIGGQGADMNASVAHAEYEFETTPQSWKAGVGSAPFTRVGLDTAHHFSGQSSLAGSIATPTPAFYVLEVDPAFPAISPGTVVTFHIYIPDGAAIAWIQPYIQDTTFAFTGLYADVACLTQGGWSTLVMMVPSGGTQVGRMGVQFYVTPAWTGTVNVDSVSW